MTAFAEQLRSDLTARRAKARGACRRHVEQHDATAERQAAQERLAAADRAGEVLLAEIFRPLVEDFGGVMESLRVLDDGQIAAEAGPPIASTSAARKPARRAGKSTRRKDPGRFLAADYRAFLADRAQRGLPPPSPANPTEEIADFTCFLAVQRQREQDAEAAVAPPQWRRLAYAARGTDDARRYEVRVVVAPTSTGTIELGCECLHGSVSDFRRDSAPALIELPRKRVADGCGCGRRKDTDRDAARQWCQNVLSQSAAAIMEATMGIEPGGIPAPDEVPVLT
jgi:hypothetical protein